MPFGSYQAYIEALGRVKPEGVEVRHGDGRCLAPGIALAGTYRVTKNPKEPFFRHRQEGIVVEMVNSVLLNSHLNDCS